MPMLSKRLPSVFGRKSPEKPSFFFLEISLMFKKVVVESIENAHFRAKNAKHVIVSARICVIVNYLKFAFDIVQSSGVGCRVFCTLWNLYHLSYTAPF